MRTGKRDDISPAGCRKNDKIDLVIVVNMTPNFAGSIEYSHEPWLIATKSLA